MSASSRPTFSPAAASATARFTVTDDLPTPPLPLATAYTLVSESGLANGITRSCLPPRRLLCRERRCSSLITSSSTRTRDTPSSLLTAAVTSRVIASRIGQPATVSQTSTRTVPSPATSMFLTMPSSVIGRWISGSLTPASARLTSSVVGGADTTGAVAMAQCYGATLGPSNPRPMLVAATSPTRAGPGVQSPRGGSDGGTAADRPPSSGGRAGQGHPAQPDRDPAARLRGRRPVREQHRARGGSRRRHVPVVPGGRVLRRGLDAQQAARRAGAPRLPDLGEDAAVPGRAAQPGRPDLGRPAAGYRPRDVHLRGKRPGPGDRRDRDPGESRHPHPHPGRVRGRLPRADQPQDPADPPEGPAQQPGDEHQGSRAGVRRGGGRDLLAGLRRVHRLPCRHRRQPELPRRRLRRAYRRGRGQRALWHLVALVCRGLRPDRHPYAGLRGLAERRDLRGGAAVRGASADEQMVSRTPGGAGGPGRAGGPGGAGGKGEYP